MRLFTFFAVVLVIAVRPYTSLAADHCDGSTAKSHHIGTYDFQTNSSADQLATYYRLTTCVENNGQTDLWVNWLIPGPESWIPPGQTAKSPRFATTLASVPLVSCVEYGNLAEKTRAPFIASSGEEQKLQNEKSLGCRTLASIGVEEEKSSTIDKLWAPFRLFFPSDRNDPVNSMLEMVGELYLQRVGDSDYRNSIFFEVRPYREKGVSSAVRLRPIFPEASQTSLLSQFVAANKAPLIRLSQKGSVFFNYRVSGEKFRLETARYEFIDEQDRVLSALRFQIAGPVTAAR